ncbi:MAG: NAD(P)/FAD-dependent oxidoreductase, partial [Parvibaculum sedimenti]
MMKNIAIVGAGLSGASAARVLRDEGYDGRLWILGEETHRPYDRPSLSKSVLSGADEMPPELAEPTWYDDNQVELVSGTKVSAFDLRGRKLELASGWSIDVDGVLLATGARARRLDVPGSQLDGVHYLRTMDDSLAMRTSLKPGMSVVIVGGGLIGCEVASTARKLGAEVTILETADELLLRVMGPMVGAGCRGLLEAMGVRVLLGAKAASFLGTSRVEAVMTQANERVSADLVLVSIGAEPDVTLAAAAGLACERGIVVDGAGLTSVSGVFAAGDAAAWPLRGGGRRS